MTHAYAESYLNDAMRNLGEAFDYAVNACKIDIEEFMRLFIVSGYSDSFSKGYPKVVAGMSGTELAVEIINKTGMNIDFPEAQVDYDYSAEYWCGWILAFYQWYTTRSFRDIHDNVSMSEVYKLYPIMHEASEEKFVDTLNAIISRKSQPTRLQAMRKKSRLTQAELSELSGVNLRTLQQYELGAKDINKASVQNVISLAKALNCNLQDILEYPVNAEVL